MRPHTFNSLPFKFGGKRKRYWWMNSQKAVKASRCFADSCKTLDIKKVKSSLTKIRGVLLTKKCKNEVLEFFVLQISHKSKLCFICVSFAKDFFFRTGLPRCFSDLASKNRLKSPPNTMLWLLVSSIFSNMLLRSQSVLSCSFSVFAF